MHGSNSTQREHTGIPVNNQQHFFWRVFFSCQLVLGWGRSKASQWSHCVTLMSLLESRRSPNSHVPTTDVVTALKREKQSFLLQGFGGPRQNALQCLGLEILIKSWNNWLGCWKILHPVPPPPPNTSALLWESLGIFLLSRCSHTGFEEFCSKKWCLILHNITNSHLKITCFYKSMFRF